MVPLMAPKVKLKGSQSELPTSHPNNLNPKKSVNQENDGHENQLRQRKTNLWLLEADQNRRADKRKHVKRGAGNIIPKLGFIWFDLT